jgi:hypothetical protein
VEAERGNPDSCISALGNAARVANALGENPMSIEQLVRSASLTLALERVESLLSRNSLTPPQIERVGELLEQFRMTNAFKLSLIAERPLLLSAFDMPTKELRQILSNPSSSESEEDSAEALAFQAGWNLFGAAGYKMLDRSVTLETLERAIVLAGRDSPEALLECERLFKEAHNRRREHPPKILSGNLLPPLGRIADRFAILETRRRAALVALAVERYRLERNGTLPDSLDSLAAGFIPTLPFDPFTGESFRFKRLVRGYVIYSPGVDRNDDGGKLRPPMSSAAPITDHRGWDDGFIVER